MKPRTTSDPGTPTHDRGKPSDDGPRTQDHRSGRSENQHGERNQNDGTAAAADAERERTRHVARIGSNLNQLARGPTPTPRRSRASR